jgi:polyisoprenoid-binding protein YceI
MKISFLNLFIVAALLASCNNTESGDTAATTDKQTEMNGANGTTYTINTTDSKVGWEGSGVGHGHKGNLSLNSGTVSVADGNISGGSFEINIGSLSPTDVTGKEATDLTGHLLSPDFFDATKFPTAKFVVTNCTPSKDSNATHMISGNLTLKDSTKNVSFPAKVSVTDSNLTATANFNIDRSLWGMSYGNDKSLKDKFISPQVGLSLDIKAKK